MLSRRRALSLLELLLVVLMLALLIALVLPAVQRVRQMANRIASTNNIRQIALACHSYASVNDGKLPTDQLNSGVSVMGKLIGHTDDGPRFADPERGIFRVKMYLSPADPTLSQLPINSALLPLESGFRIEDSIPKTLTSYSYNLKLLHPSINPRVHGIADGASNTIMWVERYARCDVVDFMWDLTLLRQVGFAELPPVFPVSLEIVTTGNPPTSIVTYARQPVTFQVRPCTVKRIDTGNGLIHQPPECNSIPVCNPYIAQTPYTSGLLVAMADGSVRTINANVQPEMFWGAVTPAGGEVLGEW